MARTQRFTRGAALALGYDDYSKNHAPQALTWLTKAKGDALLNEYVLFWTAQTQRSLKHNAEALANLEIMQREHPGSAMREQILQNERHFKTRAVRLPQFQAPRLLDSRSWLAT